MSILNTTATQKFVKLYDKATAPVVGTDGVFENFGVAARSGPWRPGFPVEGDHRFRWMTTTCSGRWRPGQQGCGRA
jgi:hypothetical protein